MKNLKPFMSSSDFFVMVIPILIPSLAIANFSQTDISIRIIGIFAFWAVIILGITLMNIFENFSTIDKKFFPQPINDESKKEEKSKTPKTEEEIAKEKIENLLKYIMNTKSINSVKPDGNHEIIICFTDRTSLKIWVANKYFAYAGDGLYNGIDCNIKWKGLYPDEALQRMFDNWILNYQNNFKRFEMEDFTYDKPLTGDDKNPNEDYILKREN